MRLLINSMTLTMAAVMIIAVMSHRRAAERQELDMMTVQDGLSLFEEKLAFHGALWQSDNELNEVYDAGFFPPHVMPQWFNGEAPANPLVSGDRPWIDIAPPDDFNEHPPDPLVDTDEQAAFWYNPNNGIVRARVPRQVSDTLTLALYNEANFTGLAELPRDNDPDRLPLVFDPDAVAAGSHASPTARATGLVEALEPDATEEAAEQPAAAEPEVPWYEQRSVPEEADTPSDTLTEQAAVPDRPSLIRQ
jgi:hypothetical protein